MRKFVVVSIVAGLVGFAGSALADLKMLRQYNCMACHAVDRTVFGPSFKAVASKYSGDAEATERLTKKIIAGGSGAWGESPMPPQPQVSEADSRTLAEYVLNLK
jgi:cytochrome c